ncbi:MAG: hypothetical protein SLAVMIC_00495 [uncultured marine phage]|uniref:Uncharacterized protein n=1 Tax=uncultured marine phage TaxID=707152 RepID=A0A8D9FRL1_9VIRU|nr:MAG: hypothetical protein SLAVMIC_00495 [uncultured marine phage]
MIKKFEEFGVNEVQYNVHDFNDYEDLLIPVPITSVNISITVELEEGVIDMDGDSETYYKTHEEYYEEMGADGVDPGDQYMFDWADEAKERVKNYFTQKGFKVKNVYFISQGFL